jgi:hypothetical protein
MGWIKDPKSIESILTAQDWALDLVQERANELGRDDWLEDPWGCLEERERREKCSRRRGVKEAKNDEFPRPNT